MVVKSIPKHNGATTVYPDATGMWRWHTIARNGKVTASSEQGYVRRSWALWKALSSASEHPERVVYVYRSDGTLLDPFDSLGSSIKKLLPQNKR